MKTSFASLFLFFFFFAAQAQLTKGNWLTTGTAKVNIYNQDYTTPAFALQYKYTNIDISASIGYFVADKLAFGLRPNFSWIKGDGVSLTAGLGALSTNQKRYEIGPFARYYFLDAEKQFNILADISYQFGAIKPEGQNGPINSFSVMAGPVIYFNSSVGLEFLLGYYARTEDLKNNYKDKRNGFQLAIGFQFHLIK